MKLNMGLKSALLVVTMMVAVPATTRTQEASAKQKFTFVIGQNKAASLAAAALFAFWVDMKTNSNKEMFQTTLAEDCNNLVKSFDLLDGAFYKNVVTLLRKVIAGRPIKFVQKDIPQEDGSTIKGKKTLNQTPYGVLGLFDAYVLSQIKDFTEHIPMLAGLYVLIGDPCGYYTKAYDKATN